MNKASKYKNSLELHEKNKGKIEVTPKVDVLDKDDLTLVYTPGVADACLKIAKTPSDVYKYTIKANTVAIVTDGSAVLGLGNIGPLAAMPVMEGKAMLFKKFAGVDAFPICLNTQNVDEIVMIVKNIAPTFGGINLEDISAPRCFEVERRLKEELDIPVFHDDQHGTAIAILAALINAATVCNKNIKDLNICINGAGSAGISIAYLLKRYGVYNIVLVDKYGAISIDNKNNNYPQEQIAKVTNIFNEVGNLGDVIKGKDVFIGVSVGNVLTKEMIDSMNDSPIVFAMANPTPEISYEEAKKSKVKVFATGRSDIKNQINNVLVFPGIFKGALKVRAKEITEGMKIASALAIASLIKKEELTTDYIIPNPFDERVADAVALAVEEEWNKSQNGKN